MKTALGLFVVLLLPALGIAQTSQAINSFNLRFNPGNSSLFEFGTTPDPGVQYNTGFGSAARAPMSTSASSVRTHSFEGSGYFTSSADSVDRAFALRLGNGVNPRITAGIQIQAVPEPSTVILGLLGAA